MNAIQPPFLKNEKAIGLAGRPAAGKPKRRVAIDEHFILSRRMLEMKRLSILTLVFAVFTLAFILVVVFLRIRFPLYPLVSYQDVVGVLPPVVFIPLYWLLFKHAGDAKTRLGQEIVFMVLAALWVEGQGMHLSANSIDNLIESLARNQVINIKATDIYRLTFFFDERLSHYMMHVGMLGLAALLIYREWRNPAGAPTLWQAVIPAGILYGFSYFCLFIEGQTVALGLPFGLITVLLAVIWGRGKLAQRPVLAFFLVTSLVAVLLFTGWGLYWGGFPQFSDVKLL